MSVPPTVRIEPGREDDGIVTVVIDRPDRLNALDLATWEQLDGTMRELDADESIRCLLLRGAGELAFAVGADITEFESLRNDAASAKEYGETVETAMEAVAGCRHPTVAVIHGACIGGGLEIACCCDLRICGESSRFGIPINRLGLTMGYGELRQLLAIVGPATAREILLEGTVFDAQRASDFGLVTRVVPDDEVAAEALATAQRIASGAPLVNRWHKKFIRRLADPAPLTDSERDESWTCFDTADFREGTRAFLDKREPEFEGE